jgi:hypothetical protein
MATTSAASGASRIAASGGTDGVTVMAVTAAPRVTAPMTVGSQSCARATVRRPWRGCVAMATWSTRTNSSSGRPRSASGLGVEAATGAARPVTRLATSSAIRW